MVDDDGVEHFLHDDIFVSEVTASHLIRFLPRLDPESIGGSRQLTVLEIEVGNILIVFELPKASDADPMTRTAPDIGDVEPSVGLTDGDTVISRSYVGVGDLGVVGKTYVDTIGVGTVGWCLDGDFVDLQLTASVDHHVKHLCILRSDSFDQ